MTGAVGVERLHALVAAAAAVPKRRKPTRPTRSSQEKRIQSKLRHSRLKALRARILD
jgi:ribosome-associated protein